jgi:hypothetical protein
MRDGRSAAIRATTGRRNSIGSRRRTSGEVQDRPRHAVGIITPTFDGDTRRVPMFMGESCGVVNDIKPAATIVADLFRDAEASLAAMPAT